MIYCVDDDNTIRDILVYALSQTGFQARGFADGVSMLAALETETPELVVLDIMMPGMDGMEVLRTLRSRDDTCRVPVIMATAKGTEIDRIQGLDSGADDYLVKPFGVMEMISRIKAVLRRCASAVDKSQLHCGTITLSQREHRVTVGTERVALTFKEFELLKLLMSEPGTVFSRERILSEIWGLDYLGESRTVDMHIKTLRQKLGEAGKNIVTVIGVGYRLEAKG